MKKEEVCLLSVGIFCSNHLHLSSLITFTGAILNSERVKVPILISFIGKRVKICIQINKVNNRCENTKNALGPQSFTKGKNKTFKMTNFLVNLQCFDFLNVLHFHEFLKFELIWNWSVYLNEMQENSLKSFFLTFQIANYALYSNSIIFVQ